MVGERAVLGAACVADRVGADHRRDRPRAGRAPRLRAAAAPSSSRAAAKDFPAGTYQLACALIIGWRSESTDLKLSLNETLREYGIGSG